MEGQKEMEVISKGYNMTGWRELHFVGKQSTEKRYKLSAIEVDYVVGRNLEILVKGSGMW